MLVFHHPYLNLLSTTVTVGQQQLLVPLQNLLEQWNTSVDILIVRAIYANGIPLNVLRNPDFLTMLKGVNQAPKDYKPPIHGPFTELLVSDGWTNVKRQPLINVVASNSSGCMFMYAKYYTGQEKTGTNIAEFLLESIEEVGSSNVLQVITDNATNYFATTFSWMSEAYKRGTNIAEFLLESIEEVRSSNVLQVITENATNWIGSIQGMNALRL
ncbi:hypothetical protein V6N12_047202 [Hibiscus sabdariffa]|uniref:DUF659 domain-containing protein n=1 Tax=Hibiscus sabdariffa TaxID=183260 RepID=A0ABR2DA69_9ROSI